MQTKRTSMHPFTLCHPQYTLITPEHQSVSHKTAVITRCSLIYTNILYLANLPSPPIHAVLWDDTWHQHLSRSHHPPLSSSMPSPNHNTPNHTTPPKRPTPTPPLSAVSQPCATCFCSWRHVCTPGDARITFSPPNQRKLDLWLFYEISLILIAFHGSYRPFWHRIRASRVSKP